jgi:hypothetical protein
VPGERQQGGDSPRDRPRSLRKQAPRDWQLRVEQILLVERGAFVR